MSDFFQYVKDWCHFQTPWEPLPSDDEIRGEIDAIEKKYAKMKITGENQEVWAAFINGAICARRSK